MHLPLKKTSAEVSRANGAKSKGPITAEGKRRSSRNALRHGFTAQSVTLAKDESKADLQDLYQSACSLTRPAAASEAAVTDRICVALWMLRRIPRAEASMFDAAQTPQCGGEDPRIAQGRAFMKCAGDSRKYTTLLRYESFHVLSLARNIAAVNPF